MGYFSLTPLREPQPCLKQEVLIYSGGVHLQKTLSCTLKQRFLEVQSVWEELQRSKPMYDIQGPLCLSYTV